jgi:TrmH family RNA methyltransferase
MGAVLSLPVIGLEHPIELANRLSHTSGFELIAAVAHAAADPFESVPRPRRLGLVLGDEHEGIAPEWLALCHRAVTIPMRPGASSLNVAVAAGILIHHFSKRRSAEGAGSDKASGGSGTG